MSKAFILFCISFVSSLFLFAAGPHPDSYYPTTLIDDVIVPIQKDTLPPLQERQGDFINNPNKNPFDLKDPAVIEKSVEYDVETGQYIISEKLGDDYFRAPTYMSFQEYMDYRAKQQEQSYFSGLAGVNTGDDNISGRIDPIAKLASEIENSLVDRLFGGTTVDIRPQGNIDLTFGIDYQKTENLNLSQFQRRQQARPQFNFDMDIQMNVEGKIGDKLNLNTSYNTGATFDFENQLNLGYSSDAFSEDDIIKNIEAGNVSLPLNGTLIQGSQNLFGLRTDLQFGYLKLSLIASQQKSQRENITLEGGAQVQQFEVFADEYDENRHFFLSHFNQQTFEEALRNLPQINSLFKISKIQVWITNDRNALENIREVVALSDLGESEITQKITPVSPPPNKDIFGRSLPDNSSNSLGRDLLENRDAHLVEEVVNTLQNAPFNFVQTEDYEKVRARMLSASEFSYDADLGYLSINVNLQPDQVLGVAYEYTYNGRVFRVGEFANDVTNVSPDGDDCTSDPLNVLFLKMLKSSANRIDLPTWNLMMKNIYNVGAYRVDEQEFRLEVLYQDPGGGDKRFIPEPDLAKFPLLRLLNLDNLNILRDPQPDGVFDYVPGLTINPQNGRVMFPVLEPFGSSLEKRIREEVTSEALADRLVKQYTYPQLYDSTLFVAREFPELNRYTIKGEYKSSVSSEISLGAFNIPRGTPEAPTVRVNAGGQVLKEGVDYEVDYNIGRVRILNDAILNSGVPVNISFEDNTLFGFQTKTLLGIRADYELGKNSNIGATFMQLFERPFTQKVNIGDDPINNKVYGLDFNFQKETPWLTKALDALPFYSTKAESSISLSAEVATLKPGHSRAINQAEDEGAVYIDDFEGSASSLDLRQPTTQWVLASVPQNDPNNNVPQFPESALVNDINSGVNRAHLNWYRIDQASYGNGPDDDGNGTDDDLENPYTRIVRQDEIFPNLTLVGGDNFQLQSLDLTYDPTTRGPYNFEVPDGVPGISAGLNQNGQLLAPETRWAGIMRDMPNTDFQRNNYEFIEFWVLSPFIESQGGKGELIFNLGSISEDILRDSRRFFENGLPTSRNQSNQSSRLDTCTIDPATQGVDVTNWSRIPRTPNITNAFENNEEDRMEQDVGLDGFNDEGEQTQFGDFLETIRASNLNTNVKQGIEGDPANDNFVHFSSDVYPNGTPLIDRYQRFNGTQGNAQTSSTNFRASTNRPDSEDLDRNNSLNETESYFEYRIPFEGDGFGGVELNEFITDSRTARTVDGVEENWYRFKIPLSQFTNTVGGISDFRSIRFMRIYLTGFSRPRTFRFARLELVRNQWRRYTRELGTLFGVPTNPPLSADFDVNSVNIEENNGRLPFGYVLPPDIVRENSLSAFQNALQNEQSLTMKACNLPDGDARAVFKIINMDMRVYDRIKMFVHAEDEEGLAEYEPGEVQLFMRLGSDFEENYYEYELPLTMSDISNLPPPTNSGVNTLDPDYINEIWQSQNFIDLPLDSFQSIKKRRNAMPNADINAPFVVDFLENPGSNIKVVGNPNLGLVKGIMFGIRNKRDNGLPICTELWLNELRLSGFDEHGGTAGLARIDFKLADLGSFTAAGNFSTIGWGQLEQKVNERSRERYLQYDLATNLELGKFLPEKWGIKIPFYAQHSVTTYTPEFDPYDLDIPLNEKLDAAPSSKRDSIKQQAQDFSSISTINFSNVRKERTNTSKKQMPWDISNFSASYNHTKTLKRNALIEKDQANIYRGGIDYGFTLRPKYIQPFKKVKSKHLKFIKEINFNPIPNSFTFNTILDRHLQETSYRFVEEEFKTYFIRKFTWDRNYNLKWDLMKALKVNFRAENQGVIDELDDEGNTLDGGLFVGTPKEYIWKNLKKGGRTKNYYHSINASFNVPLKNFPFLDFITLKGQYSATYDWSRASINTDSLGNVIQNSSNRQVNLDINFDKLYNKSKYLKSINGRGGRSRTKRTTSNKNKAESDDKSKGKKKKKEREVSGAEKALIRPFLLLKKARLNYSEKYSSVVPGFLPNSQLFGQQDFSAPGWNYVLGVSPNNDWFDRASDVNNNFQNPWISSNVFQNQQVIKDYQQTIDLRVTLEPIKDFRIELEASRSYQENHSEFFKDTLRNSEAIIEHVNERDIGSLTVSYFALNTLFEKNIIGLFNKFEDHRRVISQRLGANLGTHATDGAGFKEGYGRYQQDVLIPAFLAAYTGKDPNTTDLYEDARTFKNLIPRPNWRLTYNGLAKIKGLDEIFQNVSITHAYKSTLTVNSFNTNFQFDKQNPFGDSNLNNQTNNYYSRFEIPTIIIRETFSPLLGIDMRMKNGMNLRLDFKKARNLSFALLTNELDETKTTEYVIGFGHRMSDVNIPFLQFGSSKKKKKKKGAKDQQEPQGGLPGGGRRGQGAAQPNDLNIAFDMSYRDDITIKHILDQNNELATRGSKQLRLSPSIDYAINNQLTIKFFVDYNKTINAVSSSPNTTNFEGGFVIRFSLN